MLRGISLGLLACVVAVLLGCTIERVVLYETVNYPQVIATP